MKTPEEMLSRGTGNFINCTDYDDAIKAMKEYAAQEVTKAISKQNQPIISEEEILDILCQINNVAVEVDKYEFGLPIGDNEATNKMIEIMRNFLSLSSNDKQEKKGGKND